MKIRIQLILALNISVANMATHAVEIGDTREAVIAELGAPQGEANANGSKQLFYSGGVIEFKNGHVTHVDANFHKRAQQRASETAFNAAQRAKGLVPYDGRWVSPQEKQQLDAEKLNKPPVAVDQVQQQGPVSSPSPDLDVAARTREIHENGAAAELPTILWPGQITMVNFYADSSENCRKLLPYLIQIMAHNPDVYMCKIDVVNLGSALAHQHQVTRLPFVQVYNRDGKALGAPTGDFEDVMAEIRKAY